MGSEVKVYVFRIADDQVDDATYVAPECNYIEVVASSEVQAKAWSRFYLQMEEENHFYRTGHRAYYYLKELLEVK